MAYAAQVIQAGFRTAKLHRLDTAGYAMGLLGTLANGEDSGSYELLAVKTADLQVPEPEQTNITGDDQFQGAFTWPLGAAPRGSVEAAVFDMDLNVALEGIKKVTEGGLEMQVLGAKEADPKDICLIMQSSAFSKTSGYVGLSKKFGLLVPKASAVVLGIGTFTERQALNARLALTVQSADTYPWGKVFTLATEGATEGLMIPFTSDYFVDLHAFVGDGVIDDVVLDRTPAGDNAASPQRVFVYVNGVALTTTTDFTVTVATKTVTFTPGHIPTAGQKAEIRYEYV